jgi:hypothetical protein
MQNAEVSQVEYRIVRPCDGALRWLRHTSFPIRNAGGEVVRTVLYASDIASAGARNSTS